MLNWLRKILPAPEPTGRANIADATGEKCPSLIGSPGDNAAYIRRGNELLSLGRLEEASECYRQAVTINPNCAEGFLTWDLY